MCCIRHHRDSGWVVLTWLLTSLTKSPTFEESKCVVLHFDYQAFTRFDVSFRSAPNTTTLRKEELWLDQWSEALRKHVWSGSPSCRIYTVLDNPTFFKAFKIVQLGGFLLSSCSFLGCAPNQECSTLFAQQNNSAGTKRLSVNCTCTVEKSIDPLLS